MGALSHLRIVEIGSAAATSYCARLFADFGATVQKIEPPTGDPLRKAAPLTPKGNSAWFSFLNFNKSSVALDPKDPNASARLVELIGGCDILLDGRDIDDADCPAFDLTELRQRHPGLIHLGAEWFGAEGPYAKFAATDATVAVVCSGGSKISITAGTCEVTVGAQSFAAGPLTIDPNGGVTHLLLHLIFGGVKANKVKDGFLCPLNGTGETTGEAAATTTWWGWLGGKAVSLTVEP